VEKSGETILLTVQGQLNNRPTDLMNGGINHDIEYIDDPEDADYSEELNGQHLSEGEEVDELKKKKQVQKEENRNAIKAYRAVVEVKEEREHESFCLLFIAITC